MSPPPAVSPPPGAAAVAKAKKKAKEAAAKKKAALAAKHKKKPPAVAPQPPPPAPVETVPLQPVAATSSGGLSLAFWVIGGLLAAGVVLGVLIAMRRAKARRSGGVEHGRIDDRDAAEARSSGAGYLGTYVGWIGEGFQDPNGSDPSGQTEESTTETTPPAPS